MGVRQIEPWIIGRVARLLDSCFSFFSFFWKVIYRGCRRKPKIVECCVFGIDIHVPSSV